MSCYGFCLALLTVASAATAGASVCCAEEERPQFPDGKTIDTFQYSVTPSAFGSYAGLAIHADGRVNYSYASQPHTGSGGKTVQREWKLTEAERAALLAGLVDDGLLELEDTGGGRKYPDHYIVVTHGRWQLTLRPAELPEALMNRLLPLLRRAHPEEWGEGKVE